jgi:hypothetical protein
MPAFCTAQVPWRTYTPWVLRWGFGGKSFFAKLPALLVRGGRVLRRDLIIGGLFSRICGKCGGTWFFPASSPGGRCGPLAVRRLEAINAAHSQSPGRRPALPSGWAGLRERFHYRRFASPHCGKCGGTWFFPASSPGVAAGPLAVRR